jgi:hypothetical protein
MELLQFKPIYEFFTINDIAILDIAVTNKKWRKQILSIFKSIVIDTADNVRILDDTFMFKSFFDYIRLRQIAITGYVFNYALTKNPSRYCMPKQNNCFVQYLKIFKKNMKGRQLINIINDFRNLKSLLFNCNEISYGNQYADEYHYERYPHSFKNYLLINFTKMNGKQILETKLENLHICFSSVGRFHILADIISASPNLKKIFIRTNGKDYLPLIFDILKKRQINNIQIYDNTIYDKTRFGIVPQILCAIHSVVKLEIHVGDISGGYGHLYQTIIILYIGNNLTLNKVSFVLQYIISHDEIQLIFDHCPNIEILSLVEDYNFESPEYLYLFDNHIRYPPKLESIIFHNEDNNINIIKAIREIKTIKTIYISFCQYDNTIHPCLEQLIEEYSHIEFKAI